jgi:DNA gyrase/topoisomerase IV subunit B
MNKKHPKTEVIIPIVNPSRRSVLFFKRNRCWFLIHFNPNNEQRKTSGRNGYGAKLTNIFSNRFSIECYNPKNGQVYSQTWTHNMSNQSEPVLKKIKPPSDLTKGSGYTLVSWIPDFKRFDGMVSYDVDIISLYEKLEPL